MGLWRMDKEKRPPLADELPRIPTFPKTNFTYYCVRHALKSTGHDTFRW